MRMKKIFRKESTWRFISVALSIFLWIFINDELNPVVTTEVTVPLIIKSENILYDNGLTFTNKSIPKNVSVVLKGRKQKIAAISAESVEAFITLDQIDKAGKGINLPIEVILDNLKMKDGIYIDNFSPKSIEIDVEKASKNIFKVEMVTKGDLKPGYKIISTSITPEAISLSGGATFFDTVSSVKVYVDVTGVDYDISTVKECKIFDKYGKELMLNNRVFQVSLNIEVAKEVPVIPVISGKPDDNYSEVKRSSNPDKVFIKAPSEILDNIFDIRTETFVIDGIKENTKKKVKLLIPNGVSISNESQEVEVNVTVDENFYKKYSIQSKDIEVTGLNSNLDYQIKENNINIDVITSKSNLNELPDIVKTEIDAKDLRIGENNVKLKVFLPREARLANDYFVTVNVTNIK
jgi:YbbR domain-containing protein